MSAYRTVRSGLSTKYDIRERKKFGQCLLNYLRHAASIHRNCANPLCLLKFSGSSLRHAVTTLARLESSCSSKNISCCGGVGAARELAQTKKPDLAAGLLLFRSAAQMQPEMGAGERAA